MGKRLEDRDYYLITVELNSGSLLYFSDHDDCFNLVPKKEDGKVFLTRGSAERFIVKMFEKNPRLEGLKFFVTEHLLP